MDKEKGGKSCEKRLESKYKAQSGKAIKQFGFNMNVEFDFYGKRLGSKQKAPSQAQAVFTLNGGETDKDTLLSFSSTRSRHKH